ncbi:hypothetical protein [Promicromonospora sp. NPDC023987]|uniref:hypothetical protein n=1 Tax=Promicromonospora sp. NPDC023987 TaxID=3155360 RepID=UPI0033C3B329
MTTGAPQSATPDENDGWPARRQQDPSTTSPSKADIERVARLTDARRYKIWADPSHSDHAAVHAWEARRRERRKQVLPLAPAARPVRFPRQHEIRVDENAGQTANAVAVRARRLERFQWWMTYVVGPVCGIVGAVAAVLAIVIAL